MSLSVMKKAPSRKQKIIPLIFRKVIPLLLLIISACVPAYADFLRDESKKPFDYYNIQVPDYFLSNNSLRYFYENRNRYRYLSVQSYFSHRFNRFNVEAPLLVYRSRNFDLAAGYQVSGKMIPFLNYIPYGGVRTAVYHKQGGIQAYTGSSGNLSKWALFSDIEKFRFSGITLQQNLGYYTSIEAGLHSFHTNSNRSGVENTTKNLIQSMTLKTSPVEGTDFLLSVARDNDAKGLWNRDNSAIEWKANYQKKNLSIGTFGKRVGKEFGPPTTFNFNQGQFYHNSSLFYRINPHLYTTFSYHRYTFENPDNLFALSDSYYATGQLNWKALNNLNLRVGFRNQKSRFFNQNIQINDAANKQYFTSIRWQMKKISVFAELNYYLNNDIIRQSRQKTIAQRYDLRYEVNPNHSVALTYSNDKTFADDVDELPGRGRFGFQYRATFPKNKGAFSLDLNQNEYFDPVLQIPIRSRTQSANLEYWINGLTRISASCNRSHYINRAEPITSFRTSVRRIVSENSDIAISYRSNPLEQIYYLQGRPYKLKNILSLEYRQSFGGPLEDSFKSRWLGTVTGQVYYYPKGNPGDIKPLDPEHPPIYMQLEAPGTEPVAAATNGQSIAFFNRVKPATYSINIPEEKLDPNFKYAPQTGRFVQLKPGREQNFDVILEASSSAYIVVWNDFKGKDELDPIYAGFDKVKVILNNSESVLTDENGVAVFKNLEPGEHEISVDEKTFPPGVSPVTPSSRTIKLPPGKETVLLFGLQGWGIVEGKVSLVATGTTDTMEYPEGVPVLLNGEEVTRTDKEGFYRARVPAGNHVLSIQRTGIPGRTYHRDADKHSIKVEPTLEVKKDFNLAYLGRIEVTLLEDIAGKQNPLKQPGIVIGFSGTPEYLYTNNEGKAIFDNIPMGEYTIKLEKDYIPENYVLTTPESLNINLKSGENKSLVFILKKSKPQNSQKITTVAKSQTLREIPPGETLNKIPQTTFKRAKTENISNTTPTTETEGQKETDSNDSHNLNQKNVSSDNTPQIPAKQESSVANEKMENITESNIIKENLTEQTDSKILHHSADTESSYESLHESDNSTNCLTKTDSTNKTEIIKITDPESLTKL